MSTPLSAALAGMKRQFAAQLGARVLAIHQQFERIDTAHWRREDADALHRLLHGLTGAAGTFGLDAVSNAARVLERRLAALLHADTPPDAPVWDEVRADLASLEQLSKVQLDNDAPSLAPRPRQTALRPGSPPLIHLVEDDAEQARFIGEALKAQGYPVHIFSGITDFHAACAGGEVPAAVVMDIIFGDDDSAGTRAIAEIRAGQEDSPPVIFVSVRDDIAARLAAFRAGAARYLAKPLDMAQLTRTLDEITGRVPAKPYRILIVDDDALVLAAHAAVLRQAGMDVRALTDPLRTLDALRTFGPDVLILDAYMPEASGPEIAAVIREQEIYAQLPILFLSVETDISRQLMALGLGGDDFLTKPVQPAHLVAAVTARAKRARLNNEMMARCKTLIYELDREHLALDRHALVSIADQAGDITYANEKFCAVSGYAAKELLGRNHRILKSGEHPPEFYREMWQTISGGKVWQGEICNRARDGRSYWVASTITPFLDDDGKVYQYVSIRTEVTALKQVALDLTRARESVANAERARTEFLDGMSHELRTPMNAILGFAQILEADETLDATHKDSVREILKAGQSLLGSIDETLDRSRVDDNADHANSAEGD